MPQSYVSLPTSLERSGSDASTLLQRTKSEDSRHSIRDYSHEPGMQPEDPSSFNQLEAPYHGTEESSLLSKSSGSCPGDTSYEADKAKTSVDHDSHDVDIRGLALLSHMRFYLLWLLLGILTG